MFRTCYAPAIDSIPFKDTSSIGAPKMSYSFFRVTGIMAVFFMAQLSFSFQNQALPDPFAVQPQSTSAQVASNSQNTRDLPLPSAPRGIASSTVAAIATLAEQVKQDGVTVANLNKQMRALDDRLNALIAQRDAALAELRQGLYCSQCHRTKSEIEAKGENFWDHLRRVNGVPIPAPQSEIDAKAKEYDQKINEMSAENERHKQQILTQIAEKQKEVQAAIDQIRYGIRLWQTATTFEQDLIAGNEILDKRRLEAAVEFASDKLKKAEATRSKIIQQLSQRQGTDVAFGNQPVSDSNRPQMNGDAQVITFGQQPAQQALGSTSNVQYEDLDHPSIPSDLTFGIPQQDLPLYKWSPPGTDPANQYCQNQPSVPCVATPNAQGPREQFNVPPAVTSPQEGADCDALQANWQQTLDAASANHNACLAYYKGAGREQTGTGFESTCTFRACQEIHNSLYRAMQMQHAVVQQCRQVLLAQQSEIQTRLREADQAVKLWNETKQQAEKDATTRWSSYLVDLRAADETRTKEFVKIKSVLGEMDERAGQLGIGSWVPAFSFSTGRVSLDSSPAMLGAKFAFGPALVGGVEAGDVDAATTEARSFIQLIGEIRLSTIWRTQITPDGILSSPNMDLSLPAVVQPKSKDNSTQGTDSSLPIP